MDTLNANILLPVLALGTLLVVVVFALISKKRVRDRKHDPNDPGSSLARETPDPAFRADAKETRKDVFPDRDGPKKR